MLTHKWRLYPQKYSHIILYVLYICWISFKIIFLSNGFLARYIRVCSTVCVSSSTMKMLYPQFLSLHNIYYSSNETIREITVGYSSTIDFLFRYQKLFTVSFLLLISYWIFLAVSELCKKIYVVYCNNDHN